MPKDVKQKPSKMFREAVEGAVCPVNPDDDIAMLNTSPEIIQNLMQLNETKNKMMRAGHKQFGIQPEDFQIDDEADSFFMDNTRVINAQDNATNFE